MCGSSNPAAVPQLRRAAPRVRPLSTGNRSTAHAPVPSQCRQAARQQFAYCGTDRLGLRFSFPPSSGSGWLGCGRRLWRLGIRRHFRLLLCFRRDTPLNPLVASLGIDQHDIALFHRVAFVVRVLFQFNFHAGNQGAATRTTAAPRPSGGLRTDRQHIDGLGASRRRRLRLLRPQQIAISTRQRQEPELCKVCVSFT